MLGKPATNKEIADYFRHQERMKARQSFWDRKEREQNLSIQLRGVKAGLQAKQKEVIHPTPFINDEIYEERRAKMRDYYSIIDKW